MSWSTTVISKDKEKIKDHCRTTLLQYHKQGTPDFEPMSKVCDIIDNLVDMFPLSGHAMLKLETSGHLSSGGSTTSSCKIDITNYFGQILE